MEVEHQVAALAELTADELTRRAERLLSLARELRGESALLTNRQLSNELETVVVEKQPKEEPKQEPPRDTGRFGMVTREIALLRAQELGQFNQRQFSEALGLRPPGHQRWLSILMGEGALEYANAQFTCVRPILPRDWVVRQEEAFAAADLATACQLSEIDALTEIEKLLAREIVTREGESGLFRYNPPPDVGPREHPTHLPVERERPSYELAQATGMPVRRSAKDKSSRRQRSTPGQGHEIRQRDERYRRMQEAKAKRAEEQKAKAQRDPKWKSRNGKR